MKTHFLHKTLCCVCCHIPFFSAFNHPALLSLGPTMAPILLTLFPHPLYSLSILPFFLSVILFLPSLIIFPFLSLRGSFSVSLSHTILLWPGSVCLTGFALKTLWTYTQTQAKTFIALYPQTESERKRHRAMASIQREHLLCVIWQ